MIRTFLKKNLFFIIIGIIFAIGQMLGIFTTKMIFLNNKVQELQPQADNLAEQIANGDVDKSVYLNGVILAFDLYGNEIKMNMKNADEDLDVLDKQLSQELQQFLPELLKGKKVVRIEEIHIFPEKSILVGVPIFKDHQILGGVFLLRPISDYQATLHSFTFVYSVTFAFGSVCMGIFLWLYNRKIRNLEQTRREYVANVSHELKSPISSIKALMETLDDGMIKDEETKERYYRIVLKESNRLEKLIGEMLELSRLQDDHRIFSMEKVDGQIVIGELYDKYALLADAMDVDFSISEVALDLPMLYTNEARFIQVLTILLENAFKFVPDGGRVSIDAKVHKSKVTLLIKDSGIGIAKEDLPYIFDRFYKGDKGRNTEGSGLGLAIANEIIQHMNEKIHVQSKLGEGTVFSITVKRA